MRSARFPGLVPTPISLAGYLAWATVAIGLWLIPPNGRFLAVTTEKTAVALCLLAFLAAFGIRAGAVGQPATEARNIVSLYLMVASELVLLSLGPSDFTPILLIVIAAAIGAIYRPTIAALALVLLNLAFLGILIARWRVAEPAYVVFIYGLFQAFALLTTQARVQAEGVSRQLREVNAQLLATRELLSESARDGERLRVSRELHDVAGHRLTALALNLELLGQEARISQRREWLASKGLATELLSDLRAVVANLRRHDGIDVREALRRLADAFPAPTIHLDLDEHVRIDGADRADVVVRAGQEGLTNAVRHAKARNIWLSLRRDGEVLRLEVRDDGTSRGEHVPGYGLRGMQERVEMLGGTVQADASREGGFRLRVALPAGRGS
jgi:signal transduction histidine kinase